MQQSMPEHDANHAVVNVGAILGGDFRHPQSGLFPQQSHKDNKEHVWLSAIPLTCTVTVAKAPNSPFMTAVHQFL